MKKLFSLLLCMCMLLVTLSVPAFAADVQAENTISIEYLADGSYFVTEVNQDVPITRSNTTSGSKTATYYGANGKAMWNVTVRGEFTYTPGVSASATSASATVGIIDSGVKFVSKDAWVSGASAYGYAQVKYGSVMQSKTVVLTCDKYGNLA